MKHIKLFEQFEDDPFGEEDYNVSDFPLFNDIIKKLSIGSVNSRRLIGGYHIYSDVDNYYVLCDKNEHYFILDKNTGKKHDISKSQYNRLKSASRQFWQ